MNISTLAYPVSTPEHRCKSAVFLPLACSTSAGFECEITVSSVHIIRHIQGDRRRSIAILFIGFPKEIRVISWQNARCQPVVSQLRPVHPFSFLHMPLCIISQTSVVTDPQKNVRRRKKCGLALRWHTYPCIYCRYELSGWHWFPIDTLHHYTLNGSLCDDRPCHINLPRPLSFLQMGSH